MALSLTVSPDVWLAVMPEDAQAAEPMGRNGCSVTLTGDKAASILNVASDCASLEAPTDSMLLLPMHSTASFF